jgi:hypothetical protein
VCVGDVWFYPELDCIHHHSFVIFSQGLVANALDDSLQIDTTKGGESDNINETSLEFQLSDMIQHCSVDRLCLDMSVLGCAFSHLFEVCLPYVLTDLLGVSASVSIQLNISNNVKSFLIYCNFGLLKYCKILFLEFFAKYFCEMTSHSHFSVSQ